LLHHFYEYKEWLPAIQKSISEHGGKYLAAGGKTSSFWGMPPANRIVIVQFESLDKVQAFNTENQEAFSKAERDNLANFRIYGVEGVSSTMSK
jgi:uncharacterized protein (DUF1330 family)